jgi:S-layer homology domain
MRKLLFVMLVLLLVVPATNSYSASFNWASLWAENRYYDDTNQSEYFMMADAGVDTNAYNVFVNIPSWTDPPYPGGEYQKLNIAPWFGNYDAYKHFKTADGYPPPGNAYSNIDLNFFIDTNDNGVFDSSSDPYINRNYPNDIFSQLSLVDNVKVTSVGSDVSVSWNGIPLGNHPNNQYSVRIIDRATNEFVFDSGKIDINQTNNYVYNLGDLSAYGENLYIAIEARQGLGNIGLANRSRYYASYSTVFVDVPKGYWAYEAIYKIYDAGITKGCSQTPLKYCPEGTVTRTQMAVFLGRAKHGSSFTPPSATGIFSDVPVSYWAADWIEQFYNDGITSGCGTDPPRYCPYNSVTRTQMAVFLLRVKHGGSYTPPPATGIFADVPLSHWAVDWIEQLYKEGITTGCGTGPLQYCPENSVTRAQMAVFIMRTFGL